MRLRAHLLVERTTLKFRTACGLVGIPINSKDTFGSGDTLEGRKPGSAGCGVVAVSEMAFLVPNRSYDYCGRCAKHHREGKGI